MLIINNRVVIALSIAEYLIKNYDRTIVAREIAKECGITESIITTLSPDLVRAKIISTEKGMCGGLKAVSDEISLYDVVSAVALPANLPTGLHSESWSQMWSYIERTLKRTKLKDLIETQKGEM